MTDRVDPEGDGRDEIDWSKITQACRKCGKPMVARQNRANGSRFMGCSNYPICRETAPVPMYALLKASGAHELPGFE